MSMKLQVSISSLLTYEQNKRLLDGSDGIGGGMKKCDRVYKQTHHRIRVVRELEVKKQYLEKNPGRELKRVGEEDGGNTNKKDLGGNVKGGTVNGSSGKMHNKCSRKWLAYGGLVPMILRAVEAIQDLDQALGLWEEKLNNKIRSIILKEQKGWERALEIFEWFKRKGCFELNVIHYNIMFRTLGKAKKWSHIEILWDDMIDRGVVPVNHTYETLIDAYGKGGLKEEAFLWLEKMKQQGIEPDEVTMAVVLQVYKKAGEFQKAEEFFKRWSSDSRNVCLNPYTYNTLIDMYGRAGRIEEALQTFELMLKAGVKPTTVTFNSLIRICGSHGELNDVTLLMEKMAELQCPADTITYNTLISIHSKYDDMDKVTSYYRKMKEAGLEPSLVNYRTLLYAYSLRCMVNEVEGLVAEMDRKGIQIDEFIQSYLSRMYIRAGMLERSWFWFMRFHLAGKMSSECYSANIDAYGECGHVSEAERVFMCCQEGKKMKLSVLEYNVMIKAYGIGNDCYKACDLFDGMESQGVAPDKFTYVTLIHILASANMPQIATIYLRKMQEAGLVSDCISYCDVISSFVKLGQLEKAEGLYEEMIRHDVEADMIVYGVLINGFADAGSVKKATDYVRAMENAGLRGNPIICKKLIKLYAKVGYLKEAQRVYKLLRSLEEGPDGFCSDCMIDLYTERHLVEEAKEVFEYLKEKGEANEFSYSMMLCMYRRMNRFGEAISIAEEMRERGLVNNLLSYNNVIGLYASDRRFHEAVLAYKDMMEASIEPDVYTFKSLGNVLVESGLTKEAVGNLEMLWKRDARSGIQAWMSTLSIAVLEVSGDA